MISSSHKSSFGFTLMELLIVLILLSLTLGTVIPRIGAGWGRLEERQFLQEYVRTLRSARLRAMNSGKIVSFRIRSAERVYGLDDPPDRPIPENADIYADDLEQDPETNDYLILFHTDGSHSAKGEMEIVFDKERSYLISIHPLFGNVQWARKDSSG
jgi:prepilin-type N-terminal cleavage/methylation domain-containing protein